jgi:Domain of unknown function (DUF5122) beta-propeller
VKRWLLPSALAAVLLLACLELGGRPLAAGAAGSGLLVVLDSNSGREIATVASNSVVDAAVADGHGGWFVGGSFTRFGGARRLGLAHLLANGKVDPSWRAWIGGASGRPGSVTAVARAGSRLFVAGAFGRVDGVTRPGLAAVDTRTGALVRSWSPVPRVWIDVQALLVAGPRLLVARNWTYPTPGISALDTRTGVVDRHWNAHLLLIGDAGSFNTLLQQHGRVYVAGSFHVAGLQRNGLAAVDARSGKPDTRWAPRVPNCSVCNGFAVLYGVAASEKRVYVSGDFRQIDGVRRVGVAALDARTGAVDLHWTPTGSRTDVLHLALAGSWLYLGSLTGLSVLDARSGAHVSLPLASTPLEVLTLTISGSRLLVAGRT